jgi:hypothetical protein
LSLILVSKPAATSSPPMLIGGAIGDVAGVPIALAAGGRTALYADVPPGLDAARTRRWHADLLAAVPASDWRELALAVGPSALLLADGLHAAERWCVVAAAAAPTAPEEGRLARLEATERLGSRIAAERAALDNPQARSLLRIRADPEELPVTPSAGPDAERWRAELFERALADTTLVPAWRPTALVQRLRERFGGPALRLRPLLAPEGKPALAEELPHAWLDAELARLASHG